MRHFLVYHRASGVVLWQTTTNAEYRSIEQVWPGLTEVSYEAQVYPIAELVLMEVDLKNAAEMADQPEDFSWGVFQSLQRAQEAGILRVEHSRKGGKIRRATPQERREADIRRTRGRARERALELSRRLRDIEDAIEAGVPASEYLEERVRLRKEREGLRTVLGG